jgi:mono/diheme cytochrome c family protein
MKTKLLITTSFLFAGILIFSMITGFTSLLEKKPWPVPDNYKNMKNPVASNAESIAEGKTLYGTHCKSCHGTKGLGDGSKAAQLKTEPGNFSTADFQSQTDGSFFYKTSEGRDDMPSFKKKVPDADERWSIVNFMRTLKK